MPIPEFLRGRGQSIAIVIVVGLAIGVAYAAWHNEPDVVPNPAGCAPRAAAPETTREGVAVADATGSQRIDIVVPANGHTRHGRSPALAIQGNSTLPAGTPLAMSTTEFRRDDGDVLSDPQVTSVAQVGRDGRTVTIIVCVSPRLGEVSGYGKYVGATSLDDPRARGANVPIDIHITYPFVNRVLAWSLLAALAGLFWASLVRRSGQRVAQPRDSWMFTLGIGIASLLVAVPVIIKLVIDNPDWSGKLSSYVSLAVAVGGTVIAAAPTVRALGTRVGDGGKPEEEGQ